MTLRISWSTEGTEHILEFDAVVQENHTSESEVTQHTVESGEAISDHKRANPRAIELECFVTNTPLQAPPPSGPQTQNITSSTRDGVLVFSQEFDRVSDVWAVLLGLQREAVDLTVTTTWQAYENVQLIRLSVPRSTPEDAVSFNLSLQEVFRASSELVDDPTPIEPRGRRRRDQNTATQQQTNAEEDTSNQSILSRLFG